MNTIEKIIDLMQNKKVNAINLTNMCGLNHSAITDWKSGKAKPSADALTKIADYFNVSVDYLLGRDEKKEPSTEAEGIVQRLTKIIDDKYSKDELKSMTDDDLNLISDIFIDTIKNVKKYNK